MWYLFGFLAYVLFVSAGYLIIRAASQLNERSEKLSGKAALRDSLAALKRQAETEDDFKTVGAKTSRLAL